MDPGEGPHGALWDQDSSAHRRSFSHRFVDRLKHVMCDLHCTFT